jgi:hypothetical protein
MRAPATGDTAVWLRNSPYGARRLLRLVAIGGILAVHVCALCGALVHADAAQHHDSVHRAELGSTDPRRRRP